MNQFFTSCIVLLSLCLIPSGVYAIESDTDFIGSFKPADYRASDFSEFGGHGLVKVENKYYFFPAASFGKYQDDEFQFGLVLIKNANGKLAVLDTFEMPKMPINVHYFAYDGLIYGFGGTPVQGRTVLGSNYVYSIEENLFRSSAPETITSIKTEPFVHDGKIKRLVDSSQPGQYVGARRAGIDTYNVNTGWESEMLDVNIGAKFHLIVKNPNDENSIYLFANSYSGAHYKFNLVTKERELLNTYIPGGHRFDEVYHQNGFLFFTDAALAGQDVIIRFDLEREQFIDYILNQNITESTIDISQNLYLDRKNEAFSIREYNPMSSHWQDAIAFENSVYINNLAKVASLYEQVLERMPDELGLMYWANLLSQGVVSEQGIIEQMKQTDEYNRLVGLNTVESYYYDYLKRVPDRAGFFYWTQQYQNGMDLEEIQEYFLSSDEYKNLQ